MLKPKSYRSQKHLAWVRSKPCSHCGTNQGVVAHHLINIGNGIMGSKEDDSLAIPLCVECHALVHRDVAQVDQAFYFIRLIRNAFASGEMNLR